MKIALSQLNQIVGDLSGNTQKMVQHIGEAKKKKANLIIFPELSLVGYPPQDLLDKEHFVDDNKKALSQIIAATQGISAIVGYVEKNLEKRGKPLFNAAAIISNGVLIKTQHKRLLPTYDVFDESRHFEPGHGHQPWTVGGTSFGITICEDIWNDKDIWPRQLYHLDPIEELDRQGMNLLINISASPFHMGKRKERLNMTRAIATKYKKTVFYVNQVGGNDGLIFDGGSFVMSPQGTIVAQALDFEEDMILYDSQTGVGEKRKMGDSPMEDLKKALCLGIRDYLQKSGFKKVVIGLSGGVDSALAAALAVLALGRENVLGVMMASPFTSEQSITDAHELARRLEIPCEMLPIGAIFEAFKKTLKPVFSGYREDMTEENIQARVRGTLLMALSNKLGHLVLNTGNKSELAMGYCTLYGDLSGGLGVLSDVPKTMVYELVNYLNREKSWIPESIVIKPPSAELRPNQKDEDTLPPYPLLDKILKSYIEENKGLDAISAKGYSRELVKKVLQTVDRNEYKRRQAPIGLRVTSKAFGTGRRLPIVQAYREE